MYLDGGTGGWFDKAIDGAKQFIQQNDTVKQVINAALPGVQQKAQQQIKTYASKKNLGFEIGTKIGCATAESFEDAVPKFPIFGSDPDYKGCPKPKGVSGLGQFDLDIAGTLESALAPSLADAEKQASKIAKPRIEARLKPWFIGLPIIGLAVGVGIGYWYRGRKK